jgi:nucleotide-binding universal stress UspA family protein
MGLGYKNILVALDGSKQAEWALKKAVHVAKDNHAKLLLVHVIEERGFISFENYELIITKKVDSSIFEMLESYKTFATVAGVSDVEYQIEYGSPKNIIPMGIAKQNNCDLIVCGASGVNAVERFFLGSVSENIARFAPCDVLIVRTGNE